MTRGIVFFVFFFNFQYWHLQDNFLGIFTGICFVKFVVLFFKSSLDFFLLCLNKFTGVSHLSLRKLATLQSSQIVLFSILLLFSFFISDTNYHLYPFSFSLSFSFPPPPLFFISNTTYHILHNIILISKNFINVIIIAKYIKDFIISNSIFYLKISFALILLHNLSLIFNALFWSIVMEGGTKIIRWNKNS